MSGFGVFGWPEFQTFGFFRSQIIEPSQQNSDTGTGNRDADADDDAQDIFGLLPYHL